MIFGLPLATPKFQPFERYITEFARAKGWLPSQIREQTMGDLALFMKRGTDGSK